MQLLRNVFASAGFFAVIAFASVPALADPVSDLRASLQTAVAGVQSFQMRLSSPFGGSSTATIVRTPLRMHMTAAAGTLTLESYYAGNTIYGRLGTGGWKKHHVPSSAASPDMIRTVTNGAGLTIVPDVTEGGETYGAFKVNVDVSSIPNMPHLPPVTMTCTYEKKTSLPHDCKNRLITIAFGAYNDPGNAIVLPPDLASATDSQ